MNKSNLQYFIPTKEELQKIIKDEDTDEVLLATDGNWKVTLWLDGTVVGSDNGNIITTGRVEIYNEKLYSEETLKINEDLAEAFCYGTRYYTEQELYWILPAAVQECIAYMDNLLNFVKEEIIGEQE
jgi:hypothetical protein